MKMSMVLAAMVFSAWGHADCVIGSYQAVGSALRRCESAPSGKSEYSGRPLTSELIDFLEKSASKGDRSDFEALAGSSTEDGLAFLRDALQEKSFTSTLTAESADKAPALGRLANRMNTHLKLDADVARLTATEKAKSTRKPLKDVMGDLDRRGSQNRVGLAEAGKSCANNARAKLDLQPVEINFTADQQKKYVIPTSLTFLDGSTNRATLNYVDDDGLQSRTIMVRNGKTYFVAKDKKEWEVTLSDVSDAKIGVVRNLGDNRSASCYAYALSRKDAATRSQVTDASTGAGK